MKVPDHRVPMPRFALLLKSEYQAMEDLTVNFKVYPIHVFISLGRTACSANLL